MTKPIYLIFDTDTETPGLDTARDQIIELSNDRKVVGTMTELVRMLKWRIYSPQDICKENSLRYSLDLSNIPILADDKFVHSPPIPSKRQLDHLVIIASRILRERA